MDELKPTIAKLATGASLTREEAAAAFEHIMAGRATPSQMGAVVMAMRIRGETVQELTGAVVAMRAKMRQVTAPEGAIDILGTGGDGSGSYNISTCAALIVAGAGVTVAKQGNRALSSKCGASDVLTALGVRINLEPEQVDRCVAEAGIGFMFAPGHHPATRHIAPTRVELGTRTIFNLIGPLTNPAGVRRHLVGVYAREWVEPIAEVLRNLGSLRAYVVHGADGLDEITTTGPTTIAELDNGVIRTFEVTPEEVGLPSADPATLRGGDAATNAAALLGVLDNELSAYRDIAVFNAAAALVVAGRAGDLTDGVKIATESIESGRARSALRRLVAVSNA